MDGNEQRGALPRWAAYAIAAACLVAAGLLPAQATGNAAYVLLPYAGAVVTCGMAAAALGHVALWRPKVNTAEDEWPARERRRSLTSALLGVMAAVGAAIHMVTAHEPLALAFAGLCLAAAACMALTGRRIS